MLNTEKCLHTFSEPLDVEIPRDLNVWSRVAKRDRQKYLKLAHAQNKRRATLCQTIFARGVRRSRFLFSVRCSFEKRHAAYPFSKKPF